MKHTLFLVVLDGLAVGVTTSSLVHILPLNSSDLTTGLSTFAFGFGSITTTYLSTRLSDFIRYQYEGFGIIMSFIFCCFGSFFAYFYQSLWFSLMIIFGWGAFIFLV